MTLPLPLPDSNGKESNFQKPLKLSNSAEFGKLTDSKSLFIAEFSVVHAMAGRIRLKVDALKKDPEIMNGCFMTLLSRVGVTRVVTNTWSGSVTVEYDEQLVNQETILQYIDALEDVEPEDYVATEKVRSAVLRIVQNGLDLFHKALPSVVQLIFGAAALTVATMKMPVLLSRILITASVLPIAGRALDTLVAEKKLGVDALDGAAATVMILNGKLIEAALMTTLIALGEFIREQTSKKCEKLVADLLGLSGRSAWLVKGRKRICIPANEVKVGDIVVVYPGDLIPVDGVVVRGEACVDQSKMTGESIPVEVEIGAQVMAATVVVEGKIHLRCESVGVNTRAGMVLQTISSAPLHETKIQNYAAVVADKLVVPIFLSSGLVFVLTRNVTRLMSMLICDFSTGIRIAAPTAILSSMHRGGRRGILIKSGAALERLASVNAIVFDKTGTLTSGDPNVSDVISFCQRDKLEILAMAAAVEQRLHHPASRAIVKYAVNMGVEIPQRDHSTHMRGMGVKAGVYGVNVTVGSKRLMESENISTERALALELGATKNGESIAYIAIEQELAGVITYCDPLRPEAAAAIKKLKKLGVDRLIMATGDSEAAGHAVASACGLNDVFARSFPEQKAELVKSLKARGYVVAVIGDGINDSPALAHADVAISLNGGTEAARQSADIVLTDDDLTRLPEAIEIARGAMNLVNQNLSLALFPNSAGLVLAALGFVGPVGATLLNNGSAIAAALNSLRPLFVNSWSIDALKSAPHPMSK